MKLLVNIVLLVFITFLSTPTIVSLVDCDDPDISVFYSFAEEEIQKELQEVKAHPHVAFQLGVFIPSKKSTIIKSENLQRHDNVFEEIFCPPPETV